MKIILLVLLIAVPVWAETWRCTDIKTNKEKITNTPARSEEVKCEKVNLNRPRLSRVSPKLFEIFSLEAQDYLEASKKEKNKTSSN